MSQHQNWKRIVTELDKAVDALDGPIAGRAWSEYSPETKEVFHAQTEAILEAELNHRVGDEATVYPAIKEALKIIGEQLVRDAPSSGQDESSV